MLGLQIVIRGLFTQLIQEKNADKIRKEDIREYCESLIGPNNKIIEEELNEWVARHQDPNEPCGYKSGLLADRSARLDRPSVLTVS